MPASPRLLFVSCAMVPLTCVPWPSMSSTVVLLLMKSNGVTNRLAARSGFTPNANDWFTIADPFQLENV